MKRTYRLAAAVALIAGLAIPGPTLAADPNATSAPAPVIEAVCDQAPAPGYAACNAMRVKDGVAPAAVGPAVVYTRTPGRYGPADIQSAYGLPGGSAGDGMVVAIVDAYDSPTAESDLAAYRSYYGLPACTTANGCFRKVNQLGQQSDYPAYNAGWSQEISLDVDMVSAACPACHILLVEANSASLTDLGIAVNRAVTMGAVAVSNSYGGPEWAGETAYDGYYDHPGVAITVSTGDCGYNCTGSYPSGSVNAPEYPSASPHVVAVGGTSLVPDSSSRTWSESAWGTLSRNLGAGSGCSLYESKPSWQTDAQCAKRMQADVSAVSDPATGVQVYWQGSMSSGWGGTSAAAPIIAAIYALAGGPAPATYPAQYPYVAPSQLYDAVGGNNDIAYGDCAPSMPLYYCNGIVGYDGPTGLGTPNGVLAFQAPLADVTVPAAPTSVRATPGYNAATVSWSPPTAPGGTGGRAITGYTATATAVVAAVPGGVGPAAALPTCTWSAGPLTCTITGLVNGTAYDITVHATNVKGDGPESSPAVAVEPSAGASWYAVTPNRLVDSRPGAEQTGLAAKLAHNVPVSFQVTGRVPLDVTKNVPSTAVAVTGNLTVTNQSRAGYLALTPDQPSGIPSTSTLNFPYGDNRANGVTVPLGAGGVLWVTYISAAGNTADVIFDVTGYFVNDSPGATYVPLTPNRLVDSRPGAEQTGLTAKLAHNVPVSFQVTGLLPGEVAKNVPSNAVAVTGNLTVTNQTRRGYLALTPDQPSGIPSTSTLNFPYGDNRANGVTVPLGAGGVLWVTYISTAGYTADVIFDVTGYYVNDTSGATWVPLTPNRLVDSRPGADQAGLTAKLAHNVPVSFGVTDRLPGDATRNVPSNAIAVTGNLTVTAQTRAGYLALTPDQPPGIPSTSTLNFPRGDNRANNVTVPLGTGGVLWVTYISAAGYTTDVVFDVTGYFVKKT